MIELLLAQADTSGWADVLQSPWVVYPALVAAGFIAGVVNTIAGGGSFLTLPALMYFGGLDAKLANGTNRVAVLLSTGSSMTVFHRHGHLDKRATMRMLIPTLVGVPGGALLADALDEHTFRLVFGALFLAMAVFLIVRPKALLNPAKPLSHSRVAEIAVCLALGLYIGFLQAGMGVLILVIMSIFHARELIGANAIKNAMGFAVTIVAVAMFWWLDLIQWAPGLVMAIGNLAGGLVGARLAIHRGEKFIYAFLIVVMIATGVNLVVNPGR